jgi:hypothetical protein
VTVETLLPVETVKFSVAMGNTLTTTKPQASSLPTPLAESYIPLLINIILTTTVLHKYHLRINSHCHLYYNKTIALHNVRRTNDGEMGMLPLRTPQQSLGCGTEAEKMRRLR